MYYQSSYDSPIGKLIIVSDEKNIIGLWMVGQKYFLGTLSHEAFQYTDNVVIKQTKNWMDRYFASQKPDIKELPIVPIGSEFRQRVWKILCDIPYGTVTTYGDIAKQIAKEKGIASMSAQAVGNAVGHNPISIIIPCHRVVGTQGSLTGYAGGIDKKIALLELEGVDLSDYHRPKKGTAL
ncbi:methylated-DNA--[protein]-cysteine S-methyltransferase [Candidatus Stoquefichus massiliensis]|uniref:methylated-DNA--[protein]-cysteine S-methyltransferase n=1 Tax=Candidatus Stoquefichus massiliensis TaxID=1470350 RepID=UPI000484342D|nr:methylated-DNA--[protein]-cysteine S-methyltransferase [Candidatus Stoquefichus massiliensis]